MTAKKLDVPFVFTESGTDTLATEHKLPRKAPFVTC